MNDLHKYYVFKELMRTGDLIEFSSNNVVGFMIRLFSRKHVNHSAMVIKFDIDGCGHRRYIVESTASGTQLNLLSKRLKSYSGIVYWSALKPEYNIHRNKLSGWALDKIGAEYDYDGLFKQIFGRVSADIRKFVCSELVQMALEQVGVIPANKTILRPGEFHETGIFCREIRIL
jgi:uncharacterized protein YycO